MGRIKNEELYILDQTVSGNDRIIGSDGDDLKRTKNFSIDAILAYFQANLAASEAQDLQSVLGVGDIATSLDGFGYIELSVSEAGGTTVNWNSVSGAYYGEYYFDAVVQRMVSDFNSNTGTVRVNNGLVDLQQIGATGQTTVDFTDPIATTTIKFPAKTAGTYTIATITDYTLDSVTDNNNVTTNQVYLGKVWTSDIQNNNTSNLTISGNQSLILRGYNPNDGYVLITNNGTITSLTNGETINNLFVGRLYTDTLTNSNNIFQGIKIADTVNMSTKTNPIYNALRIEPVVTGGGTIRSIYSDRGDAIFNLGYVKADDFRLNALNTAPATAADTGTTGEIRIDANDIYVCTATNTWKKVAIATW